jgi:hypothetical protein
MAQSSHRSEGSAIARPGYVQRFAVLARYSSKRNDRFHRPESKKFFEALDAGRLCCKRGVPLRAQMHFVKTARETVGRLFPLVWREEFVKEMMGRAKKR